MGRYARRELAPDQPAEAPEQAERDDVLEFTY
jgi:hypothetical protein